MLLRMPEYCRDFKCSADSCSDNCCIGWEIDIDEKTADYYRTINGELGERFSQNIAFGSPSSFILKNERCPFLNEKNLCDIILALGEDKLCHICTEHPRYYEWFSGIKEGGVGMCCEEAARLILSRGGEGGYYERNVPDEACEEYDDELYGLLYSAREKMFDILEDEKIPLSAAVTMLLDYAEEMQFRADNCDYGKAHEISPKREKKSGNPNVGAMLEIFGELEPIDEKWIIFINQLKEKPLVLIDKKYERYLRNIGIYFIWRYFMKGVFDEEIISKVRLSVISMAMLGVIFTLENADFERAVILAKNYSKELEYSEENLEKIYDLTYTEEVFSSESLERFFR